VLCGPELHILETLLVWRAVKPEIAKLGIYSRLDTILSLWKVLKMFVFGLLIDLTPLPQSMVNIFPGHFFIDFCLMILLLFIAGRWLQTKCIEFLQFSLSNKVVENIFVVSVIKFGVHVKVKAFVIFSITSSLLTVAGYGEIEPYIFLTALFQCF
jgi:hypothetical protein